MHRERKIAAIMAQFEMLDRQAGPVVPEPPLPPEVERQREKERLERERERERERVERAERIERERAARAERERASRAAARERAAAALAGGADMTPKPSSRQRSRNGSVSQRYGGLSLVYLFLFYF